jgi:ketosteroid isomerase-like protein
VNTSLPARFFAVLLLACALPAHADWAADEAAIRRSLEDSVAAFNRGDLGGHLAIYDASVEFMTKDGPRPGIAPIEKAFRERYFKDGRPIQALGYERLAVRRLTEDAAVATARWSLTGGDLAPLSGWYTLVFLRTPAGWRAVHDHSS